MELGRKGAKESAWNWRWGEGRGLWGARGATRKVGEVGTRPEGARRWMFGGLLCVSTVSST